MKSKPRSPAIRIVLADDHFLVRTGLRAILEAMPDVEVVAEASDGHEALQAIERLKPHVALLDISMPKLSGLEVAAKVRRDHPRTRSIIVSMHLDEEYVRRALAAGAVGYVLKDSDRSDLETAVRAASRGETWLGPAVSKLISDSYARRDEPALLTSRQREVLQLIAEGLSSPKIAARLEISVKTVESHRAELMQRLDIRGVAGLVRYAIRVGMVRSDE